MPAPANDNFASASAISGASGSVSGTTLLATAETGEPGHKNYNPAPAYPTTLATIPAVNTVWYAWTCPIDGDYYFTTRDLTGALLTDFLSTVQVFTGTAVGSLTAVTYLLNQSVGDGNGADNGASVAFTATSGTVYKIQVDSRSVATGNFTLAWGAFVPTRMGGCGGCPIDFQGEICVGTVSITDVTTDALYSFGTFAADPGFYRLKYCGGSFAVLDQSGHNVPAGILGYKADGVGYSGSVVTWDSETVYHSGDQVFSTNNAWNVTFRRGGIFTATGTTTVYHPLVDTSDWTADPLNPYPISSVPYTFIYTPDLAWPAANGAYVNITHDLSGFGGDNYINSVDVPSYQPGVAGPWSNTAVDFLNTSLLASPNIVERTNLCTSKNFNHLGGAIGVAFVTSWTLVEEGLVDVYLASLFQNTASNPRFQLIYNPFTIAMLSAGTGGGIALKNSSVDNSWKISFGIHNSAALDWDNCTIELLATGGVTTGSSTTMTIYAGATTVSPQLTMDCDPTSGLHTATIQISRNGIVVGTLDFPLYPIYSVVLLGSVATGIYGCSTNCYRQQVKWTYLNTFMDITWFGVAYGATAKLDSTMTFTYTLTGVNLFSLGDCATHSSLSTIYTTQSAWITTASPYQYARVADVSGSKILTVGIGWQVQSTMLALPNAVLTVPYP